jgi:hypothetical protein
MKKISSDKAAELVKEYNLKIYKNIWHYSFNEVFKREFFLKKKDGIINIFSNPLNQHCPVLLYTNDVDKATVKITNLVDGAFDSKNETPRRVFWYLKTNSFQNFLERNTKRYSRKASERFPTSKSYPVYREKYPVIFNYSSFDYELFTSNYNRLKLPEHLSGEEIIDLLRKNNPGLPEDWIKTATLTHDNEIVAIASLVDDGKSIFADNLAAKRTKAGFGIYIFTEIARHACENSYFSFDAGTTNIYGVYKGKIFIDSMEVINPRKSVLRYFKFWEISYWSRIKQKYGLKQDE